MTYEERYNRISNCQMVLGTKCEYCKRNKSCRDYIVIKLIQEEREKNNNFLHSTKDEKLKIIRQTKEAYIKANTQNDEWLKIVIEELDKWEKEIMKE